MSQEPPFRTHDTGHGDPRSTRTASPTSSARSSWPCAWWTEAATRSWCAVPPGESPTLSHAQKARLFACTKEAVGGRVPVIANVGGNCTRDSIDFAREAESLGVDGLMCVVPYYNKPPQEGLYRHFRAIAEAVELPVMLYNIPGRCVVNMEAETTLRLARQCANVVAVKEASGKMDQVRAIVAGAPEGFAVYSGDDAAPATSWRPAAWAW